MSRYHIQGRGPASAELLIYGDIGADPFAEASNDAKSVADKLADTKAARLTVRINSIGGSVNDALAIFNAIRSYRGETVAVVDGVAFSAGSFIAMAAQRVEMAENALLMIHAPWMVGSGNAAELRRAAEMLDKYAEAMAGGYTRNGRVPRERVERWLSDGADHFFTAAEAEAEGLADAVTAAIDMAAALRFTTPAATAAQQPEAIVMADHDTPAAPVSPAVDPKETVRAYDAAAKAGQEAGARAEAKRQAEIRALFDMRAFQAPQVRAVLEQCLGDIRCDKGTAMDRALAAVEALPESTPIATAAAPAYDGGHYSATPSVPAAPLGGFRQGSIQGGNPRAAEGIRAALEIRSGLITDPAVVAKERTSEFLSMSLTDLMARELRASGRQVGGTREDIARAYLQAIPVLASGGPSHGTDHLTNILADVANKSSLMGWERAEETWQQWTIPGTLNDYREAQRANMALLDKLDKMQEHQPWNYGDLADIKQGIQGYFYGKKYGLSIQAIVNDDLGELTRAFQAWGEAASATVGDAVVAVLTTAGSGGIGQVMDEDSDPLFHADHANYIASGSGTVVSIANLAIARTAMMKQTDQNGRTLGIRPRYIIHGGTITPTVWTVLNSQMLIDGSNTVAQGERNWAANLGLVSVEEYRLDGLYSGLAWILAASRRTIEVAGVGGPLVPRVERTMISETPGIGYEMSMPFGCAALDYRGLYFNDGA